jgi:diaminopimelate decarboxylase
MITTDILGLTQKFPTPFYLYDEQTLYDKINELKKYIGKYSESEFLYAVKANHNPHIVEIMVKNGLGIDAVSINEVKVGLLAGCPKEKIMYTENNMSDQEMDEAAELGILINFNSLNRLATFGKKYPGSKVCLRFNPDVGAASHATNITGGPKSKFGIPYQQIEEAKSIAQKYDLKIVGVHQHIGSGWIKLDEPILALNVILKIAKQFKNLEFVDFGGGFGVAYKPTQKPLDLQKLGEYFDQEMKKFNLEYYGNSEQKIKLRFEPGRYPIAESGSLICQITSLKTSPESKIFAGTNTGMNHLVRPAMYGSYHPILNLSNPEGKITAYDIVGNICESADFFAKDRLMPEIRIGDFLEIKIGGAYGSAMSNLYHLRSIPAEILIQTDGSIKQIRKAQTFEEIIEVYNY